MTRRKKTRPAGRPASAGRPAGRPRPPARGRGPLVWLAAVVALAVLPLGARGLVALGAARGDVGRAATRSGVCRPASRRPDLNLLLVTLDTTRADHIHAYGFDGIETPTIRSHGARGRAVRGGGRAGAAHAARRTRRSSPASIRPRTACATTAASSSTTARRRSPSGSQSRGFDTGGFVGAYVLDHKWGVAQGFKTYFDDFDLTQVPVAVARQRRPAGQRGRRPRARVARQGEGRALLRLGPLLRRALAVRAARAVQVALRGAARTSARSRSSIRRSRGSSASSTSTIS